LAFSWLVTLIFAPSQAPAGGPPRPAGEGLGAVGAGSRGALPGPELGHEAGAEDAGRQCEDADAQERQVKRPDSEDVHDGQRREEEPKGESGSGWFFGPAGSPGGWSGLSEARASAAASPVRIRRRRRSAWRPRG